MRFSLGTKNIINLCTTFSHCPERDPDLTYMWTVAPISYPTSLCIFLFKKSDLGASLVAQWLRIRLPMQGTRVWALVWEDPTCRGATKLMRHNFWACALEPASHNYWARAPQLLRPMHLQPMLRNKRSHHNEKPAHRTKSSPHSLLLEKPRVQQQRPNAVKNKLIK